MCLCPCTDLTEVEVDFEAMEATEDRPEGPLGASRDTSTSYDGSHTVLPVRDRVFLTSQSTVSSHDPLAPEAGVPYFTRGWHNFFKNMFLLILAFFCVT